MRGKSDSDLGSILRANMDRILEQRDMDTAGFCELVNITRQAYSSTFKGDSGPTMITVKKWADTLGVDMSELLKEKP